MNKPHDACAHQKIRSATTASRRRFHNCSTINWPGNSNSTTSSFNAINKSTRRYRFCCCRFHRHCQQQRPLRQRGFCQRPHRPQQPAALLLSSKISITIATFWSCYSNCTTSCRQLFWRQSPSYCAYYFGCWMLTVRHWSRLCGAWMVIFWTAFTRLRRCCENRKFFGAVNLCCYLLVGGFSCSIRLGWWMSFIQLCANMWRTIARIDSFSVGKTHSRSVCIWWRVLCACQWYHLGMENYSCSILWRVFGMHKL